MKNDKKIYIILLSYNDQQDTIECLESMLKIDYRTIYRYKDNG